MTGKSYSIRELKIIVDYLTANKLYGEIKGRKMWMDFASSQRMDRTWQSLKETFLKRVLPDIHNPYYKLTVEQINSFRAGYDIGDRNKQKLEILTVSDDSSGPHEVKLQQTSNGKERSQENIAGENKKGSKSPLRNRSSTDTVIIDTCYETADDIRKDLESPKNKKENGETKSLRDCITYSEPLTPMLQEVLDDFQSEPENEPDTSDRENQLQIVEEPDIENLENESNEVSQIVHVNQNNKTDPNTDVASKQDFPAPSTSKQAEKKIEQDQSKTEKDILSDTEENKSSKNNKENESEITNLIDSENDTKNGESIIIKSTQSETVKIPKTPIQVEPINIGPEKLSTQLNNSNTPDASLPNNPEALNKSASNRNQDEKTDQSINVSESNISKKRRISDNVAKTTESNTSNREIKTFKANSEDESKKTAKPVSTNKARSVEPISNLNERNVSKYKKSITATLKDVVEEPSTSKANNFEKVIIISNTDPSSNANESSEIKNPCLNNLSLFNEEHNKTKYISSGSSDSDKNKKVDSLINNNKNKENEVVLLKSHSDSNSEGVHKPPRKKRRAGVAQFDLERDRGLANVFGFASGAGHSKLKRKMSNRRRTISQNISLNNVSSGSSEWTSESDSEVYVSPPRGKKSRQTKKYLKPWSARVHSLEQEGGLFVMYGRKIYPVVKDGKMVKHYLTYQPDSESDEENYWKLKYVEEKKKAAELQKMLLHRANAPQPTTSAPHRDRTPPPIHDQQKRSSNNNDGDLCVMAQQENKLEVKTKLPENIKIKFTTKNDQEIHLEGNWPQLQNALEHVVQIFHKEPQPISVSNLKPVVQIPCSSGIPSPVDLAAIEATAADPETREKVDKLESKIFKEIEEIDKKEQQPIEQDTNVTKRRGRPPTLSSSVLESPTKRLKSSNLEDTPETPDNKIIKTNATNDTPNKNTANNESSKRQTRTSRKISNESHNTSETKAIYTRRSRSQLQLEASNAAKSNEDQEVRYKLPRRNKRQNVKSTENKARDKIKKSMENEAKPYASPEVACQNTVENTEGYQDSDPTPMKIELGKKKKLKSSILKSRSSSNLRRTTRNKPSPFIYYDDSTQSSIDVPKRTKEDNSTINTAMYRSESYQLLMQPTKGPFKTSQRLGSIDEIDIEIENVGSTSSNETNSMQMDIDPTNCNSNQNHYEIGSSSNMSLPLSPELSVVESLSLSKKLLNTIEDTASGNLMRSGDGNISPPCNQFLISGVDVSVPLMQQAYSLESCPLPKENNLNDRKTRVSDSLLRQVRAFNIDDESNLTDSLDVKLRDLLLESAKKLVTQNPLDKISKIEVDENNKTKYKKRCSTPRKRKDSRKTKNALNVQNVIEKEHIESCLSLKKGGRHSCPPIIQNFPESSSILYDEINISNLIIDENVKSKKPKKKDVIKVKITRPKSNKSSTADVKSVSTKQKITQSICNYNEVNESESGVFLAVDESIELIHNHSETCLHTNECIGESDEMVEDSTKSLENSRYDSKNQSEDINSPNSFCNDSRNGGTLKSIQKLQQDILNTSDTVFHSPIGTENSSLITDDLSDELSPPAKKNKWYLFSEDETNFNIGAAQNTTNIMGFGSNLKQIFPVSCAVPNLSTITENSKDNEDVNKKITLEGGTTDRLSSQSIFDSL